MRNGRTQYQNQSFLLTPESNGIKKLGEFEKELNPFNFPKYLQCEDMTKKRD